MIGRK